MRLGHSSVSVQHSTSCSPVRPTLYTATRAHTLQCVATSTGYEPRECPRLLLRHTLECVQVLQCTVSRSPPPPPRACNVSAFPESFFFGTHVSVSSAQCIVLDTLVRVLDTLVKVLATLVRVLDTRCSVSNTQVRVSSTPADRQTPKHVLYQRARGSSPPATAPTALPRSEALI